MAIALNAMATPGSSLVDTFLSRSNRIHKHFTHLRYKEDYWLKFIYKSKLRSANTSTGYNVILLKLETVNCVNKYISTHICVTIEPFLWILGNKCARCHNKRHVSPSLWTKQNKGGNQVFTYSSVFCMPSCVFALMSLKENG